MVQAAGSKPGADVYAPIKRTAFMRLIAFRPVFVVCSTIRHVFRNIGLRRLNS